MAHRVFVLSILIYLSSVGQAEPEKYEKTANTNKTPVVNTIVETTEEVTLENPKFNLADNFPATQPPIQDNKEFDIPLIQIEGADKEYKLGDMIQLWINSDPPTDSLVSVAYSWTVLPQQKAVIWPDMTRILFGTGSYNTDYTVILTASYVFKDDGSDQVYQRASTKIVKVSVEGGNDPQKPQEPQNPTPPTTPEAPKDKPKLDPELVGLASKSYDWTSYIEIGPDYPVDNYNTDARLTSETFLAVAQAIDEGTITTIPEVIDETKSRNDRSGVEVSSWLPWFTKMSNYLEMEHSEGRMTEIEEYSKAWKEISKGLEASIND